MSLATRFTDDLLSNAIENDFVVRKRPFAIQLCLVFAIAFFAIYFTASIMYSIGSQTIFFLTLTLTIGSLAWFTIFFASRHRDLVMATEFQNAMLASAAQLSTRFCLITNREGSIVYIDPGFQKVFPYFMRSDSRTVDGLLTVAGIPEDMHRKVSVALTENRSDRMLLQFKDAEGKAMPMMVTIDVLPRPKGFFLFRGRDYVERKNDTLAPTPADTNSALLLAQALYILPEGVLIADGKGTITYVNHALEEWLGYGTGEILASPMPLSSIFQQYAGSAKGKPVLDNFEGSVTLKGKDGRTVTADIRQNLLREGKKTLGISAVISPPDTKKN